MQNQGIIPVYGQDEVNLSYTRTDILTIIVYVTNHFTVDIIVIAMDDMQSMDS